MVMRTRPFHNLLVGALVLTAYSFGNQPQADTLSFPIAITLDGQTHSPVQSLEYDIENGIVTVQTLQGINCFPGNDPSTAPLGDILLVVDGRIIPLNGNEDAMRYDLFRSAVEFTSQQGDHNCGDPDTLRLIARGPSSAPAGSLVSARIVAINETAADLENVPVQINFTDNLRLDNFASDADCEQLHVDVLECQIETLLAQSDTIIDLEFEATGPGPAFTSCSSTYGSGIVSDWGCHADWENTQDDTLFSDRFEIGG